MMSGFLRFLHRGGGLTRVLGTTQSRVGPIVRTVADGMHFNRWGHASFASFHTKSNSNFLLRTHPPHTPHTHTHTHGGIRRVEQQPCTTHNTQWKKIQQGWGKICQRYMHSSNRCMSEEKEKESAPDPPPSDSSSAIELPEHPPSEQAIALPPSLNDPHKTDAEVSAEVLSNRNEATVAASTPATHPPPVSHTVPSSSTVTPPTAEESAAFAAAAAATARSHEEVDRATFAPIPTAQSDPELKVLKAKDAQVEDDDPSESLPKLPSSSTLIRGTLWFDNMYPMRVHWLDLRYLVATHNHDTVIPKLFAKQFGLNNFTLLGATPRANEGGVFVHFEVQRQEEKNIRTPEDVTKSIITLLRAKPVHAWLTPKAVRCHLVRGSPFLDDMSSRFPYNRLKIELRGPNTALSDITIEQLYNEFNQFGKIFDLTLNSFEKDKSRIGAIQYVRMYSAVGARNCLHRLRLTVPLAVSSLPATVPPKEKVELDIVAAYFSTDPAPTPAKVPPPPTSELIMFLSYDSILKTSYVTDFFVKHPRIMVPLLGLLFAAFTYLIFDPLRSFNITNEITHRFGWVELWSKMPFGWIQKSFNELGQTKFGKMIRKGAGLDSTASTTELNITSWSAREADEEKVRKWLQSKPDRILFLTGPKGAGKQALVQKLTADRRNVVILDMSHIIDRTDDEFVKAFAASVGFTPGFALLTWLSNIMDIFTPGASKASGSSTATSTQILKILECTTNALIHIAHKENKKRAKLLAAAAALHPYDAQAFSPAESSEKSVSESSPASNSTEVEEKKPAEKQSATAQAVSGLLKLAETIKDTVVPGSSSSNDNKNAEGSAKAKTDSQAAAPPPTAVEKGWYSRNELETTEQQRNYDFFIQQMNAAKAAAAGAAASGSSSSSSSLPSNDASSKQSSSSSSSSSSSPSPSSVLPDPEPDQLPLFIIDGFNADNASKHSNFLITLVSWSAEMSVAGVGRFAFLTDATLEESVSKSLPDVKMSEVVLSDASPEAAQQFLFSALPAQMRKAIPDAQTIAALRILGGRYNDLMQLVRGVENGFHPIETVEEIVLQSMSSIKGMLFTQDKSVQWTKVQIWQVLSMIVSSPTGTVLYDDLLFNIFQGDDVPLKSMVRNDLLRVEPGLSRGGDRVKAGSPVYLEAFRRLIHHQPKLRPGMDAMVAKSLIAVEQEKINKIEEELMRIAQTTDEVLGVDRLYSSAGGGVRQSWPSDGYSGRSEKGTFSPHSYSSASLAKDASNLLARQSFLVQLLQDSHVKIAALDVKRRAAEKQIKDIAVVE